VDGGDITVPSHQRQQQQHNPTGRPERPHGPRRAFAQAHAKVNLTLDVLGRRADGYHNLASIMQTIALHDTLLFELAEDGQLEFRCDVPELNTPDNLVERAMELLRLESQRSDLGMRIELHKESPVQAGLGGGSSDAACALTWLNQLWELGVPEPRLVELAAQLGSDVPFFLYGGTAEIGGRGEFVTPLPPAEPLWLVLAKPAATGVSTAAVFAALRPENYSSGSSTALVATSIREGRPIPFEHLTNALLPGAVQMFPEIGRAREVLVDAGAPLVCMSGSGPSLFAPFRQLDEATGVFRRAREAPNLAVWLTHTV
jgi:4-diphosphocytidyl-2-C-methyl-D-erythritol kinase